MDCNSCNISGVLIEDAEAGRHTVAGTVPLEREGLVEMIRCNRFNVSGTQVLDGTPYGMVLEDCDDTIINGCTILDSRKSKKMKAAIVWRGEGAGNLVGSSRIGRGSEGDLIAPAHVTRSQNKFD